jgi:hypothetical protein
MYRGKVNLWVEDAVSRVYLKECWQDDPDILFLTAGGNESVAAILNDAEARGYANVVGFVDRDFGTSNRADWLNPAKGFRRFVPTVHELENYLLDDAALAGAVINTGGRASGEIRGRFEKRAHELTWWMACRSVIADLADAFIGEFPRHPKCPQVVDLKSAEDCIVGQEWFKQLKGHSDSATAEGEIRNRLTLAHTNTEQQAASDGWKREFSGKELFRDVRGWVYTEPPAKASPSDLDVDVARAVAQWQVANNTVPGEVTELRTAIRRKAGI